MYIRWQVTHKQLEAKQKHRNYLEKQSKRLHTRISSAIDVDDWSKLIDLLKDFKKERTIKIALDHEQKLKKLGIKKKSIIDSTNITQRGKKTTNLITQDAIFNLSYHSLTEPEKRVLSKGLKYGIVEKKMDTYEILARFEQLAQLLNRMDIAPQQDERRDNFDPKNALMQNLQGMAFEFIELSKQAVDNLAPDEREALINLSKNKEIIISKSDKGNAVVIQDVSDYRKKIGEILSATNKFKKLKDGDPTVKRENSLYKRLTKLWKELKLDLCILDRIRPRGSRAGVLYGLPKVHKNGVPIRPIISAIGTYITYA
jgi:hypothetical protein